MYKIVNGILHENNKPIFAIGESYYPSFHKAKYPVPPDGDRIGEMKKDFKLMKEMGFNHIRIAAIGNTSVDESDQVVIDTPFVEEMLKEAERIGLSISVRLQGYVTNLHNYQNVRMINQNGEEQDPSRWYDFIQCCMHHKGILDDNVRATQAMAEFYARYSSVVGYQIYNEPHFPNGGFFDYHPDTVAAYRKWIADNGFASVNESQTLMPPTDRKDCPPEEWANWRLFSQQSLSRFLNNSSKAAKSGCKHMPTFTCLTTDQLSPRNCLRGVDFFDNAKEMDIMGFTCYIYPEGQNYYTLCMYYDLAYSAAKLEGKEAWCVELDSRTKIPPSTFNKYTYAALGSGIKGIVYYQWRGDHPSEATPIPNGCGLINYDGSKTANYDNAAAMVQTIRTLSDYLVHADKVNYGVGLLFSDYASFMCDAAENDKSDINDFMRNSYCQRFYRIYTDLRKSGYSVNIVRAEHLKNNVLQIKNLYVPDCGYLSSDETKLLDAFAQNGGIIYEASERLGDNAPCYGYKRYGETFPYACYKPLIDIDDTFDSLDKPLVSINRRIAHQLLSGKNYHILCLTNNTSKQIMKAIEITTHLNVAEAIFYSNTETYSLDINKNKICLPSIKDGGIIVLKTPK